jgi:TonB family protein
MVAFGSSILALGFRLLKRALVLLLGPLLLGIALAVERGHFSPTAGAFHCPNDSAALTAFDVPPSIRDRARALAMIRRAYPRELRVAGIEGRILVAFTIDSLGAVREVQLASGTGNAQLDAAALMAAKRFEFRPAYVRAAPVCSRVTFPLIFQQ